jgi:hypothetical protein
MIFGKKQQLLDEHVLQYTTPGTEGECELTIGFDFGTSATKVVIQAPFIPGSPSYAVDFGALGHESMPALLPTVISIDEGGICSLGSIKGGQRVNDIKIELLSKTDDMSSRLGPTHQNLSPEAVAVTYSALLLRYAREWFLTEKRALIEHFSEFRWSLNLGVPSPSIERNAENVRFQRVGKAGWMLSLLSQDKISIRRALVELGQVDDPAYWDEDDSTLCEFAIVPEIVGGAVGYALSDVRREGLHIIVDVGASTVDVCTFNLHKPDGSDRYSLLTADVQLLGTLRLHLHRIQALNATIQDQSERLRDGHDPLAPLALDLDPYLIPESTFREYLVNAERKLRKDFQLMLRKVIMDLKWKRDPNSLIWREGSLSIILIGGGSKLDFFREAVEDLMGWMRETICPSGFRFIPLDLPESFKTETTDFHRLSVAWGLSHRAIEVGEVTPADQIEDIDISNEKVDWANRYISKDQV